MNPLPPIVRNLFTDGLTMPPGGPTWFQVRTVSPLCSVGAVCLQVVAGGGSVRILLQVGAVCLQVVPLAFRWWQCKQKPPA